MDRFAEAGGNFIDTADVYTAGRSEEIVGTWLKGKDREDFVLATKVRFGTMGRRQAQSLRPVAQAYRGGSRCQPQAPAGRLHRPLPGPLLGSLHAAGGNAVDAQRPRARRQGPLHRRQQLFRRAVAEGDRPAKANGWEPFTCLQALYNLLDRELEWDLLPVARDEGLGVLPWSPLRGGWLSGKYHRGMTAPVAGTRVEIAGEHGWSETWEAYANEFTWTVVDALVAIAKERGKEPAQVALNWLLRQPGVTAPIIGARNMAQLESNLGATGWALDRRGGRAARSRRAHRPLPYPFDFQVKAGARG